MSFSYGKGFWWVVFWQSDHMRTPLPRKASFTIEESMIEFVRRAGGCRTLEDKNILDMMIKRKSGEIKLELTDDQYDKLRKR